MVHSGVPHYQPSNSRFSFPISGLGFTPAHIVTTSAALHLGHFLHQRLVSRRLHLVFLAHSSLRNISDLRHGPPFKDVWHGRDLQFKGFNFLQWSCQAFSATCSSCLFFFSGERSRDNKDVSRLYSETSGSSPSKGRQWTNILLAINVLVYVAQTATQGKVLLWGAKINSLIDKGELWRLVTSSFLHANVAHLMVNCYSLNSIGPAVEHITGPRRYLTVYFTSAIASCTMSYLLCKAPAVGASGAIFGLVGSFATFVLRHRSMVKDGEEDLQHVARVIALNLVNGLLFKGIDNWGHVGGLMGGVAISWLVGPLWRKQDSLYGRRGVYADRAPIFSLIKRKPSSQ